LQEVSNGTSFIKRQFGNQYGQKAIHKSKIIHVDLATYHSLFDGCPDEKEDFSSDE
jgi:hypothetical protein